MNLTISLDDELLRRARALAGRRGTSVQAQIREHLRALVGVMLGEDAVVELLDLMKQQGGRSGGRRIPRDEAYEGRL